MIYRKKKIFASKMEEIKSPKVLVFDVDNTLSKTDNGNYAESLPIMDVLNKLKEYSKNGYYIILYTARNMRKYNGNIGKISAYTLPILIDWLNKWEVPYDEIRIGKPWCENGFYVDDKNIRPDEFLSKSYKEILLFLSANREKRKELLNNMSRYLYNSDRDEDISILFSGWNKEEIEKLEDEIRERDPSFSKMEDYLMRDIFRFLLGTL